MQSAFSDIAMLFSEFFHDLDVEPTDVLADFQTPCKTPS